MGETKLRVGTPLLRSLPLRNFSWYTGFDFGSKQANNCPCKEATYFVRTNKHPYC